jgi:hypothetical protein
MKKLYTTSLLSIALGLLLMNYSNAQSTNSNAEVAPNIVINSFPNNSSITAIFDVQFSFDPDGTVPTIGCVGTLNTGTEIWISRWSSNTIFRFDFTGAFIDSFVVAGVTGTRAMTTDGTAAYFALNTTQLKKVDFTTHAVLGTINLPPLTSGSSTTTRWATYDPTLNSGAGGFWIGNYDTDILTVDMTGAQLLPVIAAGSHGLTAMYGAAIDNLSPGGPFLWANSQTDPAGSGLTGAYITQIDVTSQMQTGIIHNMDADFPGTQGVNIAGGISITTLPGFSQPCLFANYQGLVTAAYELVPLGIKKIDANSSLNMFPNPVSKNGYLNVHYNPLEKQDFTLTVTDVTGKTIFTEDFKSTSAVNKSIKVNSAAGTYNVTIVNEKQEVFSKKIKVQ